MPKMGTRMITALADFIIMSVWLRLKLFSKCSLDLEWGQSMMPKMEKMRRDLMTLTTLKRKKMLMRMVRMEMMRPDDFDNAEEEGDVDKDGEDENEET